MPERPHRTTLLLEYDAEPTARRIERSLAQEVGEIDDDRSATTLSRAGEEVEIEIEAADLVALRAAANTWLSLASVAERTVETIDF